MIITIISLFIWFSNSNVLAYGKDLKDMVTLNLPQTKSIAIMLIVYVLGVILTLPLAMYPTFLVMDKYLQFEGSILQISRIATVIVVGLAGTFARAYLGKIVAIMGGILCCPLALIFPAIINLKLSAKSEHDRIISKLVILIGMITEVLCSFSAVYYSL